LIPCIACDEDCDVETCTDLLDWMYQLAISDAEESTSNSEKTEK
jgi:hypothetical protein